MLLFVHFLLLCSPDEGLLHFLLTPPLRSSSPSPEERPLLWVTCEHLSAQVSLASLACKLTKDVCVMSPVKSGDSLADLK